MFSLIFLDAYGRHEVGVTFVHIKPGDILLYRKYPSTKEVLIHSDLTCV
jgi:hypothetical protein